MSLLLCSKPASILMPLTKLILGMLIRDNYDMIKSMRQESVSSRAKGQAASWHAAQAQIALLLLRVLSWRLSSLFALHTDCALQPS